MKSIFTCLLHLLACYGPALAADTNAPHIILVMADDMGWGQTGYSNQPVLKTLNPDAMAVLIETRGGRAPSSHITNAGWESYTIDESVSPAAITVTAPFKDDELIEYPAIVKIEDGKRFLAYAESGRPRKRPTEFMSDGDENLFVCERVNREPGQVPEYSNTP